MTITHTLHSTFIFSRWLVFVTITADSPQLQTWNSRFVCVW